MKKSIFISLSISLAFLLVAGCKQQSESKHSEKEIQEIANTISSCIGWFKEKDFDLLFSIVAKDSNYISVHPTDHVIKGYDEFLEGSEVFKLPDFKYVRHELKDLKITRSKSGDVAWFYCILNDINTYKGQPASWENARWTGVLEKRDGKWVIVQQHFSFAQENE